jgi:hypothetical protein
MLAMASRMDFSRPSLRDVTVSSVATSLNDERDRPTKGERASSSIASCKVRDHTWRAHLASVSARVERARVLADVGAADAEGDVVGLPPAFIISSVTGPRLVNPSEP